MKKLDEFTYTIKHIEKVIFALKSELDKTRDLLFQVVSQYKEVPIDNNNTIPIPENIEFELKEGEFQEKLLTTRESPFSSYHEILLLLKELGFKNKVKPEKKPILVKSTMVYSYIKRYLKEEPYELFYILLLNNSLQLIKMVLIGEGGITQTAVDIRKIFKIALEYHAVNIVLAHNHPSGQIIPSESDKQITKRIVEAGHILDINVIDHLIIGRSGYYSLADKGLM